MKSTGMRVSKNFCCIMSINNIALLDNCFKTEKSLYYNGVVSASKYLQCQPYLKMKQAIEYGKIWTVAPILDVAEAINSQLDRYLDGSEDVDKIRLKLIKKAVETW